MGFLNHGCTLECPFASVNQRGWNGLHCADLHQGGGGRCWVVRLSIPVLGTQALVEMEIAQQPELGHGVKEMGKGKAGLRWLWE